MMNILVISDTHGCLKESVRKLIQQSDYCIHAGDFCSKEIYSTIKSLNKNFYFVKGNCDKGIWVANMPETLSFSIDGHFFALIHDETQIPYRMLDAEIIISGHTHCYRYKEYQGQIWLNPGSCSRPRGIIQYTAAMITTSGKDLSVEKICL